MCDALQSRFVQVGGRDPCSPGVSVQWSRPGVDRTGAGAEGGAGSRHLFRLPASAWAEKHVLPGAPARAPQPRRPHRLSCAPWGWGPAILLTSWDGAPSLGSNLSGALDHSGRRRLGSHGHTVLCFSHNRFTFSFTFRFLIRVHSGQGRQGLGTQALAISLCGLAVRTPGQRTKVLLSATVCCSCCLL